MGFPAGSPYNVGVRDATQNHRNSVVENSVSVAIGLNVRPLRRRGEPQARPSRPAGLQMQRSCEKMKNDFFTAPFLLFSLHTGVHGHGKGKNRSPGPEFMLFHGCSLPAVPSLPLFLYYTKLTLGMQSHRILRGFTKAGKKLHCFYLCSAELLPYFPILILFPSKTL